jgi:hypothetical protein
VRGLLTLEPAEQLSVPVAVALEYFERVWKMEHLESARR